MGAYVLLPLTGLVVGILMGFLAASIRYERRFFRLRAMFDRVEADAIRERERRRRDAKDHASFRIHVAARNGGVRK